MNTRQARVIDPILTTHSRGYRNPDVVRVGSVLFPPAPIPARGAQIVKFGREAYRLYNTERAARAAKKRIHVGYTAGTVDLRQHALSGEVDFESLQDANQVPGIDLAKRAVNTVQEAVAREKEYLQAAEACNPANFAASNKEALAGGDKWSAYATSDPGVQVDDAQSVIRSRTGRKANVFALGPDVHKSIRRHPKVVGHFYTGADNGPKFVTDEQLAAYFGVKRVVVGDDVFLPSYADDDADFVNVWGNVAILAFVPSAEGDGDIEVPSFGYTYYLNGHPLVEVPYQDRDHDVWVYPVKDEYRPVLTGMDAGFLFTDVVDLVV